MPLPEVDLARRRFAYGVNINGLLPNPTMAGNDYGELLEG